MTVKQVAVRLKPEGGQEVVRMFRDTEQAGVRASENTAAAADRAADRMQRRYQTMAQAGREAFAAQQRQSSFNTMLGVDAGPSRSARDSAEVFMAQASSYEMAEAKAMELRAALDPLGAAQARLNTELMEYQALARRGAISTTELAAAEVMARKRFDETTAAMGRRGAGLSRLERASRLNLVRQGADVFTTAAMGMNPGMIAIQQGPQILDAMATSGLKANAAMLLAGGAAAALGGAIIGMGAAALATEQDMIRMDRAATGMGRTAGLSGEALRELALEAAAAGEVSTGEAQKLAAAYVSTGRIGGEMISELIEHHRDLVSFLGGDAEAAQQTLARAMLEPDKAARDMTRQFGLLDQTSLDLIDTLVRQGDQMGAARVLMDELTEAAANHGDRISGIESLWDGATRALTDYIGKLGEALWFTESEQLEMQRRDIAFVDGLIPDRGGGTAGVVGRAWLESQRQDNADRQFQLGYQRALDANNGRTAAANQAAQLEQDRLNRNRPRRDRSAERAAREAERNAQQREAYDSALEVQLAQLRNDTDRIQALETQNDALERRHRLMQAGLSASEAEARVARDMARLDEARLEEQARLTIEASRRRDVELASQEGAHRTAHILEQHLDLQRRIQEYASQRFDLETATAMALLDQAAAEDVRLRLMERSVEAAEREHELTVARNRGDANAVRDMERDAAIERRARDMEARMGLDYGEGVSAATREIDREIAAATSGARREWTKDLVRDIRRSGLGNAVADELLDGGDRAVDHLIDRLFSVDWAGLFSGGGGSSGLLSSIGRGIMGLFGRNADGTDYWEGGWTWVGERGPELAKLPRGSKVREHGRSLAMAAAGEASAPARGGDTYVFEGNLMTPEFWSMIRNGDKQAASVGAQRGSSAAVSTIEATAPFEQKRRRMLKA